MRVYVDTSVYGGVFDKEFEKISSLFFDQAKLGRFTLVTSAVVQAELDLAPQRVRDFYESLGERTEIVKRSAEALRLQEAYMKAGIVPPKYQDDALHVATATVASCAMIVSWNFKHIVHFDKIALYNATNILNGYGQIAVYSPMEVIDYEEGF